VPDRSAPRLMALAPFLSLVALLQVAAPADTGWRVDHDVAVPMRDGVSLRADLYRPREGRAFPVLVYRTPYDKREVVIDYTTVQHAVARGYAVLVQDVRGRYASDGTFEAYRQEGRDGYDTIEWAAVQPWSTGAIGMFGLSYPAAVQWLAAMESPPHLKAIVPAMSFASPRQFFYSGGAFDLSWASWTWMNIAPDLRVKLGVPGPRTYASADSSWAREEARVLAQRPLLELPDFQGIAPWYYEWMRHEPTDPWWDWAELTGRYGRTSAAVLNLSGWHDEAYGPNGATRNFMGLVAARGTAAARTAMRIGPWVHGVDATARTRSGEREFGPDAAIDYDEVVLRWLDHHVRGIDNGVDREPPVRVFVMGANRWRDASTWPLPGMAAETLWFAPSGALTARAPSTPRAASSFVSDPDDPVRDPFDARYGAHDFRALAARNDLLTFETAPLAGPLEVIGGITVELHLETDARDVDVYVKLLDVAPDGTAYNLMSPGLELLRASYREPERGRQLLEPGRTYLLRLGDLITANEFAAGHRIRVQVMGAFQPHFSLNLQTGAHENTSAVAQRARITIRHDPAHPSRIVLPVRPRDGR
jgi:putative CocE/NonD family hydrolase